MDELRPVAAIVDYGLGNLYSIQQACASVGLGALITHSRMEILNADAVILPGVGAFGDAMSTLRRLDLVGVLQDIAASPKSLVGICLGLQLLMTESYEFGRHQGLGIIEGPVVLFNHPREKDRELKVPQIGWNKIYWPCGEETWKGTLLEGVDKGQYMYFIHSYTVQPTDRRVVLSLSRYGHIEFCSSIQYRNIFACQFHPERSGPEGMKVYRNLAARLKDRMQGGIRDRSDGA